MNKDFIKIIVICQRLREKYGFEYEDKCKSQIEKYSKEIIEKDLVNKCSDVVFAKQLCMANSLTYV
jgi:hypothetical protein